jgi:hypothetical protein
MSLSLPKFRAMHRIKTGHVGDKEANADRNRQRTYLALLKAGWVRWNVFAHLELTPAGEHHYERGRAKGWHQLRRFDRQTLRA